MQTSNLGISPSIYQSSQTAAPTLLLTSRRSRQGGAGAEVAAPGAPASYVAGLGGRALCCVRLYWLGHGCGFGFVYVLGCVLCVCSPAASSCVTDLKQIYVWRPSKHQHASNPPFSGLSDFNSGRDTASACILPSWSPHAASCS
jgi:hypothetical protein